MTSGMALQWSWNVTIEGMNGLGIRPEKGLKWSWNVTRNVLGMRLLHRLPSIQLRLESRLAQTSLLSGQTWSRLHLETRHVVPLAPPLQVQKCSGENRWYMCTVCVCVCVCVCNVCNWATCIERIVRAGDCPIVISSAWASSSNQKTYIWFLATASFLLPLITSKVQHCMISCL